VCVHGDGVGASKQSIWTWTDGLSLSLSPLLWLSLTAPLLNHGAAVLPTPLAT
jgi:hypothetical protein